MVQGASGKVVAARWGKPREDMEWSYDGVASMGISRDSVAAGYAAQKHDRWRA